MTLMDPALDAALTGPNPLIFGAVEIVLAAHTIRVIAGSGVVIFDGKTFTGDDATYGVLDSVEDLTDGTGEEAPSLKLGFIPASTAAAADLSSASMQGSPVSIWLGALDPSTGLVIGEPLLVFLGELDVATLKTSNNSWKLEIEVTSLFEAFFLTDDGAALSDQFHKYLWPGETGLEQATGVLHEIYWGTAPASGVSR